MGRFCKTSEISAWTYHEKKRACHSQKCLNIQKLSFLLTGLKIYMTLTQPLMDKLCHLNIHDRKYVSKGGTIQ